jgi:hypothetical protein
MPQNEARAWWADVEDVRESIERRRAGDAAVTREPVRELAHVRARRAMAERESVQGRTGRFDREPTRTGRFDRDLAAEPMLAAVPPPAPAPVPVSLDPPAGAPRRPLSVPAERRTVQITGRPGSTGGNARLFEIDRRRAARRPSERLGTSPDRLAMWAVLLGLFLILVAATSSHAAMLGG